MKAVINDIVFIRTVGKTRWNKNPKYPAGVMMLYQDGTKRWVGKSWYVDIKTEDL